MGVAAVAAGVALRVWFILHQARIAGDSLVYGDIAVNMIRHHVYGFTTTLNGVAVAPRSTIIRLPGYPLFLAASFLIFGMEHYGAVLFLQVAIDLWTCLLMAGLARRVFGARAGMAALWLGALCPFMANYVAAPLTETLTLFCIALAFYGMLRWKQQGGGVNRWLYAIAFALAYAVLLRPEQGMLAAAVVPGIWLLCGWKARPALLVAVLTVLPLGPWAVRNWMTFHLLQPLAPRYANDPGEYNPAGFDRWYRTFAVDFASTSNTYWNYNGGDLLISDLPDRAFDSNAQYAQTQSILAEYEKTLIISPALDQRFDALGRERIRDNPLRYYLALPVARVVNMAFRPRVDFLPVPLEWWKPLKGHAGQLIFAWAYGALNVGYFVLAAVGFSRRRLWQRQRVLVWTMLATIGLRVALLLTLDNSETRYTLEFFPVLIVLGAACFTKTRDAEAECPQ
jgi:4-amino-4-deoxy-L-arabinose transferase-like glycosyltransferase